MSKALLDCKPIWLAEGGREHQGLELDCPGHAGDHRIRIWFANPGDGGPPMDHPPLFWLAAGAELAELTIIPARGRAYEPLDLPGHWIGWIVDGRVVSAGSYSRR